MPYTTSYQATVLADSPAGYWRLGDGSGAVATDQSGNNRAGTYLAGVTLGQPGALIDADASALFDGVTGAVTVPDVGLDLGDVVTVEAWIRLLAANATGTVLSKGANAYGLTITAGVPSFDKSEVAAIVSATVNLNDLGWHHVVATKNGATNVIYVDGVDRSGAVTNLTLADTAIALQIGRLSGGTSPLRAYLDEVAVYPTALSAARVLAHVNAGRAIYAGAAAIPSRGQYAAVLVNPGVASPPTRVRYASYGAGVATPGAQTVGVEVVTEAQAVLRPGKRVVYLTRFSPGTPIPGYYRVISETTAEG
jgi:hypothetical protein